MSKPWTPRVKRKHVIRDHKKNLFFVKEAMKCQNCCSGENLTFHHIKPKALTGLKNSKLRPAKVSIHWHIIENELNEVVVLCNDCHVMHHQDYNNEPIMPDHWKTIATW